MNKKAVSGVITAVLLILLAIAATGVLWVVISNFIGSNTKVISLGVNTLDVNIMSANYLADGLQIRVKRQASGGDLSGVRFSIEDESGNSENIDKLITIGELEQKTYSINKNEFTKVNSSKIKKITVFPLVTLDNKNYPGVLSDEFLVGKDFVSNQGLVAYWPFDNNLNDISGNENNGVCYGTNCPSQTTGKFGGAYLFDGVDDYVKFVSIPSGRGQTDYSLSLWVKSNSQDGTAFGQDEWDVNSDGIKVYLQAGQICAKTLSSICTPSINYGDSNWHHVVLFRNGASIQNLYVDGVYIVNSIGGGINNDGGLEFKIGADYESDAGSLNYFKGSIDDIKIYNRSLSAEEVAYLYKYN